MNSFSICVGWDFSLALGGLQNQFGFGVNYLLYGYYITKKYRYRVDLRGQIMLVAFDYN